MNEKEIEKLFRREIDSQSSDEIKSTIKYLHKMVLDERTQILLSRIEGNYVNLYNSVFNFSFIVTESEIHVYRNKKNEGKDRKEEASFSVKESICRMLKEVCQSILESRFEQAKQRKIKEHSSLFEEIRKELNDEKKY